MNYYRKPVSIDAESFDRNLCGHPTHLYHLTNGAGMEMQVTNYGGKSATSRIRTMIATTK